jgi:hypothetical protein
MGFGHEARIRAAERRGNPPLPEREGQGVGTRAQRDFYGLGVSAAFGGPTPSPSLPGRGIYSSSFPAVSGSQNRVTTSAIATTPIVYHRPANGSPVLATIYWLMKGRKPPK